MTKEPCLLLVLWREQLFSDRSSFPLTPVLELGWRNPSPPPSLADSARLCTWTAPEPEGQNKRICWGKIPHLPPAVSSCLLAVQGAVLLTSECTIPMAAATNDPCHCGRQEQWKRLLLYKYLLPFLRRVSQLNYKCVGNVQSHTPLNSRQGNFVNPSLAGETTYILSCLLFNSVRLMDCIELL